MVFGVTDIDTVRTMAFPAGYVRDGTVAALPGVILVSWKSGQADKLFQVYVNGEWAGVTSHPEQRDLLIQHDHTHTAAIEVIWVTPDEIYEDYATDLTGWTKSDGGHAVLSFPRRASIPWGSEAWLFGNGGQGEINYEEPIVKQPVWFDLTEKWGWGLDAFGRGDFGYSGTGASGWGRGSFGHGEFGFDADMFNLASESLAAGRYKFAVRLVDALGNMDQGDIIESEVHIDPLPVEPGLSIESYNHQTETLTLNIS